MYEKMFLDRTGEKKGFNKIVSIFIGAIIVISLAVAFIPVAQDGMDDFQGEPQCTSEGCYWNSTVSSSGICYNTSDQFETCPATLQTAPLLNLFTKGGVLMILATVFVLLILVKIFGTKKIK